jgi:hypothetical protein
MDFSSPAISVLIIWFGVYEYRRRETLHGEVMEHLRRGEILPGDGSKTSLWRVITTGSTCAVFAGFAGMLFYAGMHSPNNSAMPLEIMGGMITAPVVILVLIFVRDRRQFAGTRKGKKESGRCTHSCS